MRSAFRISLLLLLMGAAVSRAQINPATQIRWPVNCVGGNLYYDIVHNTCTAGVSLDNPAFIGTMTGPRLNLNNMTSCNSSTSLCVNRWISIPGDSGGFVLDGATTNGSISSRDNGWVFVAKSGRTAPSPDFQWFAGGIGVMSLDANGLIIQNISPSTAPLCPNGPGGALTTSGCSGGGGGGGTSTGTSAQWTRLGVVIAPIATDPMDSGAGHIQEPSALVSNTPELLTDHNTVRLYSFTNGWWPVGSGGSGMSICFGEAPDDISQPTRFPNCIQGYGRSNLSVDPTNGRYLLAAVTVPSGHLDIYEATTISALSSMTTPTYTNVLSCGGNGSEVTGSLGSAVPVWDAANSKWRVIYGCQYASGSGWVSYLATGPTLNALTKYQTTPVLGHGSSVNMGGLCDDCGIAWMMYSGGKLHAAGGGGPTGAVPTPYSWHMVDSSGVGNAWVPDAKPMIVWKTNYEGLNRTNGQTVNPYLSPSLDGTGTMVFFTAYHDGCSNLAHCIYPSYVEAATIPHSLTTVLNEQIVDSAPTQTTTFQVNGIPASCGPVCNFAGSGVTDSGNGTITFAGSGGSSSGTTLASDGFAGGGGTPLTSHVDDQGHTWSVYTANGAPGVTSPQLTGSSSVNQPVGSSSTAYGDMLNSVTPPSADYSVSVVCNPAGTTGTEIAGVFARASNAAATNYLINVSPGATAQLNVYRVVTGTATLVGSYSGPALVPWNVGTAHKFTLRVSGSTITALVDTTTAVTGTDSSISAAGQAGFRVSGGSSMTCTNFAVVDGSGGGGGGGTGIANSTLTVGTGAISTCSSASTVSMAGVTTGMTINISPASDVSSVTGWGPGTNGGLYFTAWPTANAVNYKVCNSTSSSITPSASTTWNVSVK